MSQDDKTHSTNSGVLMRLRRAFFAAPPRCDRSEQRGSQHRRSEAGNVFFALFGAVAVVGVLGAGIMSTMRGPLTTMVEVNRAEEAKAQLRLNARLILLDAGKNSHCGAADDVGAGGTVEYTEPVGWAAGSPSPSDGGQMPILGGSNMDPWGTVYGYCAWDNGDSTGCANHLAGEASLNAPAIALISAGPDRQFQTTCAQAGANNKQGDDLIEPMTYSDAVAGSGGLWSVVATGGADGDVASVSEEIQVLGTGTSTFGGGASFGADVVTSGSVIADNISSTTGDAGTINISGDIAGDSATFSETLGVTGATTLSNTLDVSGATALGSTLAVTGVSTFNGDGDFNAALNVDGATTLNSTLAVTGASTLAIVNATGAVDFDDTLNVDGNTTLMGELAVDDAATFGSWVTINADGNTAGVDAFVVNNSTPAEILNLDQAGNLTIAGNLAVGDVTSGRIMVADGAAFTSVAMIGDAAIVADGTLTIANDAVTFDKMQEVSTNVLLGRSSALSGNIEEIDIGMGLILASGDLEIDVSSAGNDECLKYDGGAVVWGDCYTTGGGGDGVGLIATAADQCIVSEVDGGGFRWAAVACSDIAGDSDRIQDTDNNTHIDVDTSNDGLTNSMVFTSNGVESMRILADGKVGIGKDNPSHRLTVGGGNAFSLRESDDGNNALTMTTDLTTSTINLINSNMTFIRFSSNTTTQSYFVPSIVFGSSTPTNASALVEMSSTTRGFLPPRMDTTARNAILTPATGLMIYNTTSNQLQLWNGTAWVSAGNGANASSLVDADNDTRIQVDTAGDGSANTTIFTNATAETMRITSGGNVGVGTTTPATKLSVTGTISASQSLRLGLVSGNEPTYIAGTLAALDDVNASGAADGECLVYDSATTSWTTGACGGATGLSQVLTAGNSASNLAIADLLDPVNAQDAATKAYVDSAVTAGGSKWTDDGSGNIRNTAGGRVGIGGAPHASRILRVAGDSEIIGDLYMIDSRIYGGNNSQPLDLSFNQGNHGFARIRNNCTGANCSAAWQSENSAGRYVKMTMFSTGHSYANGAQVSTDGAALSLQTISDTAPIRFQLGSAFLERARFAPSGSLLIGTETDAASALLNLTSTTRGFLPPRMDTTARNAIASPATGLVIYNTTTNALETYNGTTWGSAGGGGGAINDLSDAATTSSSMYVGSGSGLISTGVQNTVVGIDAFVNANAGINNTLLGWEAGGNSAMTDGTLNENTAIGARAGYNISSGSNGNTFLGYRAGNNVTTGDNNIVIGNNIVTSGINSQSELNIGNTIYGNLATGRVGIGVVVPETRLHVVGDVTFGAFNTGESRLQMVANSGIRWLAETTATGNLNISHNAGSPFDLTFNASNPLKVGIGTNSVNNSALMEIASTNRGFLPPRMTTVQRNAIASPATGLVIYNTTTNSLETYNGTVWGSAGGGAGLWTDNTTYISRNGDVVVTGTYDGTGTPPVTGAGTRMFFDTSRSSFRAGTVSGTQWDTARNYSFAFGNNPTASEDFTIAMGSAPTASGYASIALGTSVQATGYGGIAMGSNAHSTGFQSYSVGTMVRATGYKSMAFGNVAYAGSGTAQATDANASQGNYSVAFGMGAPAGTRPIVTGNHSFGVFMGDQTNVNLATPRVFGLYGTSHMLFDPVTSADTNQGCIRYNDTSNAMEFTNNCESGTPTWTALGGGGGTIDALTDAATNYATDFNMFMGQNAGAAIATGGQYNIGIGQNAIDALTTGDSNIAIGYEALTAGANNLGAIAIGHRAGASSNNNHRFMAIGRYAAENYNGDSWHSIVAIGDEAARNTTFGPGITVIGNEAYKNWSGDYNTVVGSQAMLVSNGGGGNENTVMGSFAGGYFAGSRNVLMGFEAFTGGFSGDFDHRGDDNVFIGSDSARDATGNTNHRNTFIGSTTGQALRNGADNILIGYNVNVPTGTTSNYLSIGNTIYGSLSDDRVGIGKVPDAGIELDVLGDIQYTGVITDISDMRLKTDIQPLNGSDMINRIAAVDTYTFRMKDDASGKIEYGVMAQEIEKIFPELVNTASDEMGTKSVNYVGLIAPMIEATKSLKSENEALKAELAEIKGAQADILEQVHGLSRHTGYGTERAALDKWLLLAMMAMMSGMGYLLLRRKSV